MGKIFVDRCTVCGEYTDELKNGMCISCEIDMEEPYNEARSNQGIYSTDGDNRSLFNEYDKK